MGKKDRNVLSKLTKEVKKKSNPVMHPNAINKHNVVEPSNDNTKNVKSTLETNNLDEFLTLAKLSQKKYDVLNEQIVIQNIGNQYQDVDQNQFSNVLMKNILKNSEINVKESKSLAIPKRPKWKEGIPAKEFERMEREAFLNWRRNLAEEEEKNIELAISPYEKNIEIWRQLWLVVEKSQVLIQIVDGRNPLFFRSLDLESYVKEVNPEKEIILLVNKADLLSKEIRRHWADYFKEKNIKYIFFSALVEGDKLEKEEEAKMKDLNIKNEIEKEKANKNNKKALEESDSDNDDMDDEVEYNRLKNQFLSLKIDDENEIAEENEKEKSSNKDTNLIEIKEDKAIKDEEKQEILEENIKNQEILKEEVEEKAVEGQAEEIETKEIKEVNVKEMSLEELEKIHKENEEIKILNREELIEFLKSVSKNKTKIANHDFYYLGFIGYPNVGKSSVINVLMKKKRVGVALMPGKTKHYQTLFLPENKDYCLMDCPGLVFPSFSSSKAEMLVNGILPVDTLRDYLNPISIIIKNIPRKILEILYKINLPDIFSATQFLQLLATKRGFYTGRSLPDEARTSKWILKDYTSGKLLYCYLRPDYSEEKHGTIQNYMNDENFELTEEEKLKQNIMNEIPADFDDNYEKINIQFDDLKYLGKENDADKELLMSLETCDNSNKKISKDMRRVLKFAAKRGDITEEEYESVETYEQFESLLIKLEKLKKNSKDLVKAKKISFAQ